MGQGNEEGGAGGVASVTEVGVWLPGSQVNVMFNDNERH